MTPSHFLLIDDDPANNLLTKLSIKKVLPEAEVTTFLLPQLALEYIATAFATEPKKTILLLDINMPLLDGWEVLDKLSEMADLVVPNFTIYMLSSSVDPVDKLKAQSNPLVSGYFEKPLQRSMLKDMFA